MKDFISTIYLGPLFHSLSEETIEFIEQGALVVSPQGVIEACGSWQSVQSQLKNPTQLIFLPPHHFMMPGLIDLHTHLPQYQAAGAVQGDLLSWLEQSIYPAEAAFSDSAFAKKGSQQFFEALLRNGTTTAAVFLNSDPEAADIAFQAAERLGNRVVMGLNLMDTGAPDNLINETSQLLTQTETLYQRWHGVDEYRLQYAWMPRFALTSTDALLSGIQTLHQRYPDAYIHTHLSEQRDEVQAVLAQFPWAKDYTDVYEHFGLLSKRSLFAHGIHLSESEIARLVKTGSSLVHCPSSNLFLKSGRFAWFQQVQAGMSFGLGSDVGAGPELSLFKVMKDAQYVQAEQSIRAQSLFYRATLGGAKALGMAEQIGNFEVGKEADFIILNSSAKPNMRHLKFTDSIEALLSGLIYLGDDRIVVQTYVRGKKVYGEELP